MADVPHTLDLKPIHAPDLLLTRNVPGTGGTIRQRDSDFFVEELPLYTPNGQGEHVYLFIEKRGLTTQEAVEIVGRHFGVSRSAIGFAGLKDKHAVTRQTLSVHAPGRDADSFPMLQHPDLTVLWVDQHSNKLRRGHLVGNRFSIKIRNVDLSAAVRARRCLDQLMREGLPNRFGPQRFGVFGRNHLIGRALFLNDCDLATRIMLGLDCPLSPIDAIFEAAREHFANSRFSDARDATPVHFRTERLVLAAMARGGSARDAWGIIDPRDRGFYYSAFQSAVFNRVLFERLRSGTLATLIQGDLAMPPTTRKSILVTSDNLAELQSLVDRYELNPSGPLWGTAMKRASGSVDRAEVETLDAFGLSPEILSLCQDTRSEMVGGSRRALRVPITDIEIEGGTDEHGPFLRCAFDLPRGAFATTVLEEIMKIDLAQNTEELLDDE